MAHTVNYNSSVVLKSTNLTDTLTNKNIILSIFLNLLSHLKNVWDAFTLFFEHVSILGLIDKYIDYFFCGRPVIVLQLHTLYSESHSQFTYCNKKLMSNFNWLVQDLTSKYIIL